MSVTLLLAALPAWGLDLGVEVTFTPAGGGDAFRWSCMADDVALGERIPLPLGTAVPENRAAAIRVQQVEEKAVRAEVLLMDLFPQPEGYVVVDYLFRDRLPAAGLCGEGEGCMLSAAPQAGAGRLDVVIWPLPPLVMEEGGEADREQVRQRARWKRACTER